jgi:acetylornithine deacetylase/succinyl-diaminopimelate desuccinylase-like protein
VPLATKVEIEALLAEACGADCTYTCDFEGYPTLLDTKSPVVRMYIETLEQMLRRPVVYKQSGGGTDGRYAAQCGMAVIVHQGTCGDAQGENEHVDLASLEQLVATQVAYVARLADAASNTIV